MQLRDMPRVRRSALGRGTTRQESRRDRVARLRRERAPRESSHVPDPDERGVGRGRRALAELIFGSDLLIAIPCEKHRGLETAPTGFDDSCGSDLLIAILLRRLNGLTRTARQSLQPTPAA